MFDTSFEECIQAQRAVSSHNRFPLIPYQTSKKEKISKNGTPRVACPSKIDHTVEDEIVSIKIAPASSNRKSSPQIGKNSTDICYLSWEVGQEGDSTCLQLSQGCPPLSVVSIRRLAAG